MSTVNILPTIENLLTPNDIEALRRDYPSLLRAFQVQQTVINQLIVRVGGSGPGVDLTEIISDINDLESSVSDIEAQEQESLVLSLSARLSLVERIVNALAADFSSDTRAIDSVRDLHRETRTDRLPELIRRIEALEAQQ